jgi:hypothetical protein
LEKENAVDLAVASERKGKTVMSALNYNAGTSFVKGKKQPGRLCT